MSSNSKSDDDLVNNVRTKLNRERIKLWEPPYSLENGLKGMYPEGMVARYSTEMKVDPEKMASILEQLRKHSVSKLQARKKLKDSGLTTLIVKIAGKINLEKVEFPIEISLQSFGSALREIVSTESKFPVNRLKLIGCGHVIVDDAPLFNQHIRPDSQIMAIILTEAEAAEKAKEDERRRLQEARKDAEILSSQSYAMTLHERGKAALRRKEYEYSLLLLLEADEEFSKCRSSILNSVDNYALLCLDISWCYLCLRSVEHLPDAGIVAYYHGHYSQATAFFCKVESELNDLKVDDGKLSHVMAMGFKATEARLALRHARGDVERAVTLIIQKREERAERRKKEAEQRRNKMLAKMLGNTVNNEILDVDMYNSLISMGYSAIAAREGLKQANNNLNMAIELLHNNPNMMSLREFAGPSSYCNSDATVAQVASLGYDGTLSRQALQLCNGNIECAVAMLAQTRSQPDQRSSEELAREQEAYERIRKDVPDDEEAHLDLTLEDEMNFLAEYKVLLEHAQAS
uniref:UBA domain-containing protein n=1 Tax=Strigamia maritima TaxID=126957 RepID=T1IP99_STRMM